MHSCVQTYPLPEYHVLQVNDSNTEKETEEGRKNRGREKVREWLCRFDADINIIYSNPGQQFHLQTIIPNYNSNTNPDPTPLIEHKLAMNRKEKGIVYR